MEAPVATKYQNDIVGFVVDVLQITPRSYQKEAMERFIKHRRLCVRGPHGLGKTAVASWIVLWALACFPDVKVPTTATAWRQLSECLWPEIRSTALKANWSKIGINFNPDQMLTKTRMEFGANRFAVGLASKEEARIEGFHAPVIVYIFDEAKSIPTPIWDAAEGALVGGERAYALAVSTPAKPVGRFYEIQSRKPGLENWDVMYVTSEQVAAEVPGYSEWAKNLKKLWGEHSSVYRQRVLGEFAEDEEGALIPLSWIEAANDRWYEQSNRLNTDRILTAMGVDVGGEGSSKTVIAKLYDGNYFSILDKYQKPSTMETVGYVQASLPSDSAIAPSVDVIGIGVGVVDRLKELGVPVRGVNVSNATTAMDVTNMVGFTNLRSYLAWRLREKLDPAVTPIDQLLCLPPDDELTGDLVSIHYKMSSNGYKVESKDKIKKGLGRSPDCADALTLALWIPPVAAPINQTANPFWS